MKEQLERMFPGAVVKAGSLWLAVQQGAVTIEIIKPGSVFKYFSVKAFHGPSSRQLAHVTGSGLDACLAHLRDELRRRSESAPTKTARTRAARVLRVLDAAKVGEVGT